jgi:S-adenosylmethionine-dependent methyltransferase
MTFTPEDFDAHFDKWKDWPSTPWNRLLYSTCHHNLQRYLGAPPLQILDVGGGNGEDTFFLVQLGHTVTLVDFSSEMLADAQQQATELGVSDQVTLIQTDVTELTNLFAKAHFDAILCHNMIKFVDDGYQLLDDLSTYLKPDGLLSITAVNPHSEVYRQAIFQNDLGGALAVIGQDQHLHPWFGKFEKRHAPEDIIAYLQALDFTLMGHYGLRNIVDYLTDNQSKFDPGYFSKLEELEHALTDRYPYYLLARMFQIIMQK